MTGANGPPGWDGTLHIVGRVANESGPTAVGLIFPLPGGNYTVILSPAEARSFGHKMLEMANSVEAIEAMAMTADVAQAMIVCDDGLMN